MKMVIEIMAPPEVEETYKVKKITQYLWRCPNCGNVVESEFAPCNFYLCRECQDLKNVVKFNEETDYLIGATVERVEGEHNHYLDEITINSVIIQTDSGKLYDIGSLAEITINPVIESEKPDKRRADKA